MQDILVIEGEAVNHKRTYWSYCEEGLQVRTNKRKQITRPRVPMLVPNAVNQRCPMVFVFDYLANGRRFRVLNIVDDFSREYVLKIVDFSISDQRVARELSHIARKLPKTIVCDNGPEFTSKAMHFWAKNACAKLRFSQPGKPTQNAFVESFNGKMRAYCLDLHRFASIEDARPTLDEWQRHFNHVRPHRHSARYRLQCPQRKQPEMLNVPYGPMLQFRGTVSLFGSFRVDSGQLFRCRRRLAVNATLGRIASRKRRSGV